MADTDRQSESREKRSTLLGEWSWEKYVLLAAGTGCVIDAMVVSLGAEPPLGIVGILRALIRDGAFQTALLFGVLYHQSELRYRMFPDIRND